MEHVETQAALAAAMLLVAAAGLCGCGGDDMICGPGTIEIGNVCIAEDDGDGPPPSMPPPGTDAGPPAGEEGDSTPPRPGTDTTPPPPAEEDDTPPRPGTGTRGGCSMEDGECAEWARTIATAVSDAQVANGCSRDLIYDDRINSVAQRHAEHQASVDMLTAESPDGSLFDQMTGAGVAWTDVGALFGGVRTMPESLVARWAAGEDTNEVLQRCDTHIGVGAATGESPVTYVTVLLAVE